MLLGTWICTIFQEKLNKVKVGRHFRVTCEVKGRLSSRIRGSVDVGARFDKLPS
jgi:hypothetical protein